jgi:hypothetical protein
MVDLRATGGLGTIFVILGIYVAQGQSGKILSSDLLTIDVVWIATASLIHTLRVH